MGEEKVVKTETGMKRDSLKFTNWQIDNIILAPYRKDEIGRPVTPLDSLINRSATWKDTKTVHWLRRFRIKLNQLIQAYRETKRALFEQYGVKDDKGIPKIFTHHGSVSLDDPEIFHDNAELIEEIGKINPEINDLGFYAIQCRWDAVPPGLDPMELAVLEMLVESDHTYEAESGIEGDGDKPEIDLKM